MKNLLSKEYLEEKIINPFLDDSGSPKAHKNNENFERVEAVSVNVCTAPSAKGGVTMEIDKIQDRVAKSERLPIGYFTTKPSTSGTIPQGPSGLQEHLKRDASSSDGILKILNTGNIKIYRLFIIGNVLHDTK